MGLWDREGEDGKHTGSWVGGESGRHFYRCAVDDVCGVGDDKTVSLKNKFDG